MVSMRIAIGNIFSWLVTALFGVITLLLAFESWALLTNHKPISDYIRHAVHSYPGYAFVIAVVVGILLGHFLWGPAYGRTSPTDKPK
jgi:purine-cytosine permease-like protein